MERKMFWGLTFVCLGLILLANYMFGFNLPVFRILFSLAIIYLGLSMLFGSFGVGINKVATDNQAVFSSSQFKFDFMGADEGKKGREYSTVFGESELDLTDVDLSKGSVDLKMNTVFGDTKLIVRKDTPLRIRTNAVFGNAALPNKNSSAMGKFKYESQGLAAGAPALNVDANVVFGQFEVIQR